MSGISKNERIYIVDELSVVNARHIVLKHIKSKDYGIVDQTKILTATSELTRNIIRYAEKGTVYVEHISRGHKEGLRLTFEDSGPGIADIGLAMKDGYTSAGGMGLGLPGTKRIMDEFEIVSQVDKGTRVVIVKWTS